MEHMPHYKMMMGRDFIDLDPVEEEKEDEDLFGDDGGTAVGGDALIVVSGAPVDVGAVEPLRTAASLVIPIVASKPFSAEADGSDQDIPF